MQWFEQKKSISDNSQGSGTNQRANQLLADRKQVCQNHVTFQLKKNTTVKLENFPFRNRGKVVWGKGQQVNWTGDMHNPELQSCSDN